MTGAPREVIVIDGKTLRRSGGKKDAQAAVHMVSAFAAHRRLVLGQVKVADKSNAIEGAVVTLDAISCPPNRGKPLYSSPSKRAPKWMRQKSST